MDCAEVIDEGDSARAFGPRQLTQCEREPELGKREPLGELAQEDADEQEESASHDGWAYARPLASHGSSSARRAWRNPTACSRS